MLSIDKKMAGVEEVEFSVTEAIENKLEIVLKADQNIEASIQAGIAAGTKEVSFFKSFFFLSQKQLSFFNRIFKTLLWSFSLNFGFADSQRSYQRWLDKRIYKTKMKFWAFLDSRGCIEKKLP